MIQFRSAFKGDKKSALVFLTSEQVKEKKCALSGKKICDAARAAVSAGHFEGNKGDVFPLIVDGKMIVLFGLGKKADLTPTSLRGLIRRGLLLPYFKKSVDIEVLPHEDTVETIKAVIEADIIGTYVWKKYIAKKADDKTVEKKNILVVAALRPEYAACITTSENVNVARELINDNADVVDSLYLEKTFRGIVKGVRNVEIEVLGRKELAAKKFGLLLAVNQGSNKKPRVLIAKYTGADKDAPYTAFIGKGLTFDSGGLNLKPTGSMETMREDMSGAAAVLASLKNAIDLKIKKNIIFACGIAENAIDANSYKPGDVITGYAGISVEIGNTDAEGRLVLADVLAYVNKTYKPARIIDIATLTGAVVVALGHDYTGLVSNNDALAEALLKSAVATDDRAWRLPNYPEIKDSIKSKIADIRNTSTLRGAGGTITGAEFLRRFIGETPWAHLDIAGTAFVDGDNRFYYGHGATGVGVRLFTDYMLNI
jgi:leucyl aminopeptidase